MTVSKAMPPWDDLTDSAQDTLVELAHLFMDGESYNVEIVIVDGGKRSFHVRTTSDNLRRLREARG